MNERELRVLRALADEVRRLQQEIQAARKDRQTREDASDNEPVSPIRIEVAVTPQLDPARREYYEAENRDHQSRWRKLKPWIDAIGVGVAVSLAVFNLLTLLQIQRQTPGIIDGANAAKSAANTASDELTSVQRPFITYKTLTNQNLLDSSGKLINGIEFKARYENDGTTPTRGARHRIGYKDFPKAMPATFTFRLDAPPLPGPVFAFSPKATIDAGQVVVPKMTLDKLWAGQVHLYFWGWLEYRDVFPKTPTHITMFCVELTEIKEISLPDPRKSSNEIGYTNCPRHNCEDDDCEGEPYGDGLIWRTGKNLRQLVTPPKR